MSSFKARVGLMPNDVVSVTSTMPLLAQAPLSLFRCRAPEAYRVPSVHVAVFGSWLISRAYGSSSSLFGLKRLPLASMSVTKPVALPFVQVLL